MASKTTFSNAELHMLTRSFGLGALRKCAPIAAGSVETNYLLELDSGKYILRYYEGRTMRQVEYERALLDYLSAHGFPCAPGIVPSDNRVPEYRGKPYMLFEYVQGEHISSPSPAQAHALIRLIARLNTLTRGLHLPGSESRLTYRPAQMLELATQRAQQLGTQNARNKLNWYRAALATLELPHGMEQGVCHCDFYYTNVLYRDDEITALLDFDDANETWLYFDIVSATDFFRRGFDHETWSDFSQDADIVDLTQAREYLAVFEQICPIPALDRAHLYDILKLGILVDCIWYFDRGTLPDFFEKRKLDALDRLGRDEFNRRLWGADYASSSH